MYFFIVSLIFIGFDMKGTVFRRDGNDRIIRGG